MMVRNKEKRRKRKSVVKLIVINEEELIRQVSLRPVIYDRTLKAYRKTSLRQQCWREISQTMDATVEECRKRWRSLRDTFVKHYKQIQSTDDESIIGKHRKWVFYDKMSFLIPHLDNVNFDFDNIVDEIGDNSEDGKSVSCGSIDLNSSNDVLETNTQPTQNNKSLDQHHVEDINVSQSSQSLPTSTFVSMPMGNLHQRVTTHDSKNGITHQSFCKHQCPLKNNINSPTLSVQCTETNADNNNFLMESDEKFLMSCVPTLRRLTMRQNALARLKIQQILFEIEFDEQHN